MSIQVQGQLSQTVDQGTIHSVVIWEFLSCQEILIFAYIYNTYTVQNDLQCPLVKGYNNITVLIDIPLDAPRKTYSVSIAGSTSRQLKIWCLEGQIVLQ